MSQDSSRSLGMIISEHDGIAPSWQNERYLVKIREMRLVSSFLHWRDLLLGAVCGVGTAWWKKRVPARTKVGPLWFGQCLIFLLAISSAHGQIVSFRSNLGSSGSLDALLSSPFDVAIRNSTGQIYVADAGLNRVKVYGADGTFQFVFGGDGSGAGQFNSPEGIAIDQTTGRIYVADTGNNRIQRFNAFGTFELSWGTEGDANGQFFRPTGVAVNSTSGEVYVAAGLNERIQRFDAAGNYLGRWGVFGTVDGAFDFPTDVAVHPVTGQVYVVDQDNSRIQRFSSTGIFELKWGSSGPNDDQFNRIYGLSVDSAGRVLVTDIQASKVKAFDADGKFLLAFGEPGIGDGQLDDPVGIATGPNGRIFIADNQNFRVSIWQLADFRPTLTSTGGKKLTTTRRQVVLQGTSTDATRVEFKAGRGKFTKARGSVSKWRIPLRLQQSRTVVKIRAIGPGGRSKILAIKVFQA